MKTIQIQRFYKNIVKGTIKNTRASLAHTKRSVYLPILYWKLFCSGTQFGQLLEFVERYSAAAAAAAQVKISLHRISLLWPQMAVIGFDRWLYLITYKDDNFSQTEYFTFPEFSLPISQNIVAFLRVYTRD